MIPNNHIKNEAQNKSKVLTLREEEHFTILFAGDTSFGENYLIKNKEEYCGDILKNYGYDYPLEKLKPLMVKSNFVVMNLETPITSIKKSPYSKVKKYCHWTDPEKTPSQLLKNNVSLISLSNNHTFDYGIEGFDETLQILQKNNIPVIGAGNHIHESSEPYIIEVKSKERTFKCAILTAFNIIPSYDKKFKIYASPNHPGLMPLDINFIKNKIQEIKKIDPETFIIFFPHWGDNYRWKNDEQTKLSKLLSQCGVNLIIGHGAHMIQEIQINHNICTLYSIGNFMFNSPGRYKQYDAPPYSFAAVLDISFKDNDVNLFLNLYPIMSDNKLTHYQPRFLEKEEFEHFLGIMKTRITTNISSYNAITSKKDQYGFYLEIDLLQNSNKITQTNKWIGMMINEPIKYTRENHIYPWIGRAFVIDRALEKQGYKLLCYNPRDVNYITRKVSGYFLENGQFFKITIPIPKVNYDFFIGKHNRDDYILYVTWAEKHLYDVYPSKAFKEFTSDKLETARAIMDYANNITPKTQAYERQLDQVCEFTNEFKRTFLKPRYGNKGNGIVVVKYENMQYFVDFYNQNKTISKCFNNITEAFYYITQIIGNKTYIIQGGVDVIRDHNSVFEIRVIQFYFNKSWHLLTEIIKGTFNKDVSNMYQGGIFQDTKVHLRRYFSFDKTNNILNNLDTITSGLAHYLNQKYNQHINEVAFDILIDKDGNLFISEINVKPGLVGEPMTYSNFFIMTDEENDNYEKYTCKHGEYIAKSLLDRCHKIENSNRHEINSIWFDKHIDTIPLSEIELNLLSKSLYQALKLNQEDIKYLPDSIINDNSPRIIFLTLSNLQSEAITIIGRGHGLNDALNNLLHQYREKSNKMDFDLIKIDVVRRVEKLINHDINLPLQFERSLYGLALDESIGIAYLPEELVSQSIINSKQKLNIKKILKNSLLLPSQRNILKSLNHITLYLFQLQSYFYSSHHGKILYRGHAMYNQLTTDCLYDSALKAGQYLIQSVKKDGSFLYEYLPKKDTWSTRYNVLRHAGSVYAMLELYEVNQDIQLLKSAQLALTNLLERKKSLTSDGNQLFCIEEKGYVKLGANALALLSLSKYISITHDKTYLETAKKLALWIKYAQDDSGAFNIHKIHLATLKNSSFISGYYPGEAIFSLLRFYQIDPDPLWLKMAYKAANYIIKVRDKGVKIENLEHDHWLLYGLNELHHFKPDPIYLEHAEKITKAIMLAQYRKSEPLDYFGSFYKSPRSTPAAVRAEGLYAAYQLFSRNHQHDKANEILEAMKACIQYQLGTQFHIERALYLPNPQRALGGFSKSLTDFSIRIDYVQHNLSSILGLYKILRNQ